MRIPRQKLSGRLTCAANLGRGKLNGPSRSLLGTERGSMGKFSGRSSHSGVPGLELPTLSDPDRSWWCIRELLSLLAVFRRLQTACGIYAPLLSSARSRVPCLLSIDGRLEWCFREPSDDLRISITYATK